MVIFDLFRSGYRRGYSHGFENKRRLAYWELILTKPLFLLPLFDRASYYEGYQSGYLNGVTVIRVMKNK